MIKEKNFFPAISNTKQFKRGLLPTDKSGMSIEDEHLYLMWG